MKSRSQRRARTERIIQRRKRYITKVWYGAKSEGSYIEKRECGKKDTCRLDPDLPEDAARIKKLEEQGVRLRWATYQNWIPVGDCPSYSRFYLAFPPSEEELAQAIREDRYRVNPYNRQSEILKTWRIAYAPRPVVPLNEDNRYLKEGHRLSKNNLVFSHDSTDVLRMEERVLDSKISLDAEDIEEVPPQLYHKLRPRKRAA